MQIAAQVNYQHGHVIFGNTLEQTTNEFAIVFKSCFTPGEGGEDPCDANERRFQLEDKSCQLIS